MPRWLRRLFRGRPSAAALPHRVAEPVHAALLALREHRAEAEEMVSFYRAPPFNGDVDYLPGWRERRERLGRAVAALERLLGVP